MEKHTEINPVKQFVDKIPPLEDTDAASCPTDAVLLEWARSNDAAGRQHLISCTRCSDAVRVLRRSFAEPGKPLAEFMTQVEHQAKAFEQKRHKAWLTRIWLVTTAPGAHRSVAWVSLGVILLLGSYVWREARIDTYNQPSQTTVFDSPEYTHTLAELRDAANQLEVQTPAVEDARRQVEALNVQLSVLQQANLSPQRRAELAEKFARYQLLLYEKYRRVPPSDTPTLKASGDVQKVVKLFQAIDEAAPGPGITSRNLALVSLGNDQLVLKEEPLQPRPDAAQEQKLHETLQLFANSSKTRLEYHVAASVASFQPRD